MFKFNKTDIEGVYIIESQVFGDYRGYFLETYNKKDFDDAGLKYDFVQDNQSKSRKGVLRGLHFQKNHPQAKLVRVLEGEVFDVAVDLRKDSKTYGKWVGVILTAENKKQFMIPRGFAHGFVVLSKTEIKPGELWGGTPAKFIKMVDPEQSKEINQNPVAALYFTIKGAKIWQQIGLQQSRICWHFFRTYSAC